MLPRLLMPNSFCLPPVEYCRGTTPTQAAKSRPRRNAAPLPMAATVAVETSGPKAGIWRRRSPLASSLLMRSISSVMVLMSVSVCFHSCHSRSSSQRRRGLRFCTASSITVGRVLRRGMGCAGRAYRVLRRSRDDEIEQEGKVLELDPNFIDAYYFRGVSYVKKSMYKEGMAEFEKGMAISPVNPEALTGLGYGYAVTGRRAEAQKVLDKLNELSKHEYVSAVWRAKIYAGLEEKDEAFEWLEKAYDDHSIVSVGYIKTNPMFDPLRSDPRYSDLLRRTNLQPLKTSVDAAFLVAVSCCRSIQILTRTDDYCTLIPRIGIFLSPFPG